MSPAARQHAADLAEALKRYNATPLAGVATDERRLSLAMQMVEGVRRVAFVESLPTAKLDEDRANPQSPIFDPLRGAVIHARAGDFDEACWLAFLATHFGKSKASGWQMVADTYGAFGARPKWTWTRVANDLPAFEAWAVESEALFRGPAGSRRAFSNHRRYQPFKMTSERSLPRVVNSYVRWVGANRGHSGLFSDANNEARGDPNVAFDHLYSSMDSVTSFGRLGKFDYLTTVGKLGFANIEPGSPYLKGATGPERGARLLFDGRFDSSTSVDDLDTATIELGKSLGLRMQVMEDAICNWQKSPTAFKPFRG